MNKLRLCSTHFYRLNAQVLIVLLVVVLSLRPAIANTENNGQKQNLVIGLIIFPPYMNKNADGKCYGSAIADIRNIFPRKDYQLELYCASPLRIYRDFNKGDVDITINIKSTKVLSKNVIYSREPYQLLDIVLNTRLQSTNKKIVSISGYNYDGVRDELSRQGYQFIDVANTKEAVTVFFRGGADAILSYKKPFEHYESLVRQNVQLNHANNVSKQTILKATPTYFTVNKLNKNSLELAQKIDDYFTLKSDKDAF